MTSELKRQIESWLSDIEVLLEAKKVFPMAEYKQDAQHGITEHNPAQKNTALHWKQTESIYFLRYTMFISPLSFYAIFADLLHH